MDMDTAQKMRPTPLRGCYQCGDPNYLIKDCPYRLDVQRLTAEQREELIEDLIALKDAVAEEEVAPPQRRILFSAAGEKCAPVAAS